MKKKLLGYLAITSMIAANFAFSAGAVWANDYDECRWECGSQGCLIQLCPAGGVGCDDDCGAKPWGCPTCQE